MMLGVLAGFGIRNLGLRLFNIGDAAPLTIFGHLAGGALFMVIGCLVGLSILRWERGPRMRLTSDGMHHRGRISEAIEGAARDPENWARTSAPEPDSSDTPLRVLRRALALPVARDSCT